MRAANSNGPSSFNYLKVSVNNAIALMDAKYDTDMYLFT